MGHVGRMGKGNVVYWVLVGIRGYRIHCGDVGVNGKITLKWIFRNCDVVAWTGSNLLRKRKGGGTFECGNKPSCSVK